MTLLKKKYLKEVRGYGIFREACTLVDSFDDLIHDRPGLRERPGGSAQKGTGLRKRRIAGVIQGVFAPEQS